MCPSTGPVLQGRVMPALTAASSSRRPWAKRRPPKRALRGALQPGIELCALALADELDNGFREGAGLRQCARGAPLGERLRLARWARVRTSHHQPRRPAGRERRLPGFTARQQALTHQALAGCGPLGLTQALGIAGDGGITAAVATWAELRPELAGVTAARIPALDQVVFVGGEETLATISAPLPFGQWRRMEVAVHRGSAQAQRPGDGLTRPPLAASRPHRLLAGQPSRPALAGELLGRRRGGGSGTGTAMAPSAGRIGARRIAAWTAVSPWPCARHPCSRASAPCCRR
jgi:hypothetical protein